MSDLGLDQFSITTMSKEEWQTIEKRYQKAVRAIVVPDDLDPVRILQVNADIDEVYSIARFHYSKAKSKLKYYEGKLARYQKTAKLGFSKAKRETGVTEKDLEALVIQQLESAPLPGDKKPIFEIIDMWTERKLFLEAVIDTLLRKSGMMINGNGALKLDAQGRGESEGRKKRRRDE